MNDPGISGMARAATFFFFVATLVGVVWLAPDYLKGAQANPPSSVAETDLAIGKQLYADHCASCHGVRLEGQANWRSPNADGILPAPPHDETGHTWHHGDNLLFAYTKLGGKEAMARQGIKFESGMPEFASKLSDAEIRSVLAFIKSRWPPRIQRLQAERTKAE